jgi:hypothetical protein
VTAADLARLRDIHRQLQSLSVGLQPVAPASGSLAAALWSVRTGIRYWTGEDVDKPPGQGSEDAASVAEDLQGYCPQGPRYWRNPVLDVIA